MPFFSTRVIRYKVGKSLLRDNNDCLCLSSSLFFEALVLPHDLLWERVEGSMVRPWISEYVLLRNYGMFKVQAATNSIQCHHSAGKLISRGSSAM